ncbi:MAG: hypothetical protein HWQ38_24265 [Nostoc sp. NMS7]|uniref:hypothetical protein n=1 Tax=Nostoc sp. NMS7 TaxID=2815391 RepID=UPI0025FBD387|nr:hypothetical protein [Nostoc sp. NMS7]MBN3949409.1 hypothetical protein [Nostoc sp. NMS7]
MAAISPLVLIFQAIDQASPVVKNIISGLKENVGVVGALSLAYNETKKAITDFAAQGQQAYQLLIGQNVELQGQLIATQASLAATNKVISDGFEVKDPTKAIQALTEPVNQAIADLRKGSFDLVGVTSNDLIPLFQSVANESSKIGASLQQSTELALGFGAATQTLKIPLQQTSNELKLILQGQVSSENRLASALNLNNEIVNRWKSQGVFVDELNKKLATFRAGNALAAQTIDGVVANGRELFLEFGRIAGEPFLQPIVTQLNILYTLVKNNRETIIGVISGISSFFLEIGTRIQEIATILQPIIEKLAQAIGNELNANLIATENATRAIADLLVSLVQLTAPVLDLIASIALELSKISNSPFGQILIETGLLLGVLSLLQPAIVGLGINLISVISQIIIFGESAGAAYTAIGGFEVVINTLALGGLPALQAGIAAAIPELATFGVAATAALAPLLPLIALGGLIVLTLEVKGRKDLEDGNEELEEYRKQIDAQGEQTLDLAKKLKVLADSRIANGSLDAEEEAQSKRLESLQQNEVQSIQDKIKSIKELQNLSPEQEATRKIEIEDLENQIKLLQKYSEGTKLQPKDLQVLGNEYQQLGNKVNEALAKFNHPATDAEFKQAAKDVVDYTQQQLKAGDISQQQAEARLAIVRDDTRITLDLQKSTDDAIVKSREDSLNRLNELAKVSQQKIKAQIDDEVIGNFEGQQKILESKERQLQLEIELIKSAIQKEDALRVAQVNTEVDRINKEIAASQARLTANPGNTADDKQKARLEQANLERLQSQKNAAQASLNIQSESEVKRKSQLEQNEGELSSVQSESRKNRRAEALKEYDEQQQILDSQNAQRLITEQEYNARSLTITKAKGEAEIKQLEEERAKLPKSDKEGLEAIAAKEAQIRQKIAASTEKFEEEKSKVRIALVDTEQKELAAKLAQSEVSQQQFNQQSLALTKQRLQAELDEVNRQRAKAVKTGDTQRLNELNATEADIRKRGADAVEKFDEDKSKARIALLDNEQKELAASLAEGIVSQQQYNQQSLLLTQQRLQAELDEVQRQRVKAVKAGDAQRLDELNAQEADIRKRGVDAIAQNQEQQVALIDQAQKKATDIVSQSESDRLVEIDKLEATQTIHKVEAEKLRTDAAGDRIKKELALEKDRLAQLEALPPFSDPAKEEQRQGQIRASRLKTSQITKSLIDNEVQQREAAFRVVEDKLNKEIQQIQNNATAENQALEKQEQLQKFISSTLENQIKLLEAKKNLVSSVAGFYEGELNVLKETTKNQREQARLAETAAENRLNSARASFEIEKEITKEKQEQQQIDLAMKELELQGEQSDAASATLKAQKEQKKVEAKFGVTQEEKDTAALDVKSAVDKELRLQFKGLLLGQEKTLVTTQGQQELDNLGRTQQLQDDQNRLGLANARVSKGRGRRELRSLREDILKRGGVTSTRDYAKNVNFNALGGGSAISSQLAELQAMIQGVLSTGAIPQIPQSTQRLITGTQAASPIQVKSSDVQAATQKTVGAVNITLNNQFTGDDATNGKAANKVTQDVRKQLYDLGVLLTR